MKEIQAFVHHIRSAAVMDALRDAGASSGTSVAGHYLALP